MAGLEVFLIAILRQGEPKEVLDPRKLCACTVATLENTAVNSDHTSGIKANSLRQEFTGHLNSLYSVNL